MKQFLSITVAFVAGWLTCAYVFSPAFPVVKAADSPPNAVKAADTRSSEQYKFFETTGAGGKPRDRDEMERDLNKLADDGWRVRTGVGYRLVLAK